MDFIHKMIKSHNFFIKESPKFLLNLGGIAGLKFKDLSLKNKFYYPIAYIKFMRLESADWLKAAEKGK